MDRLHQLLGLTVFLFILVFSGAACGDKPGEPDAIISVNEIEPVATEPKVQNVTLAAVGDCLMHNTQVWSGDQGDGTYNFDFFFTEVADKIKVADYASVCFEAPMAGPETGYTNYPCFNSPDAIADTFKNAGFDLVVTAHNHAFDRGYEGAMRTLDILHAAGLDTVGTYRTLEDSRSFLIRDVKGIKVGYLAYSYGTNGIPVPEDRSYCFNFLDKEKVLDDIAAIRPQVDALVLILHWGVEYQTEPEPWQVEMAHEFMDAGVDVILGSHPHVIQTMEVYKTGEKDKFVIYSMGNFISHQRGIERHSGIILYMNFQKDMISGQTCLTGVSYIPTHSHIYYEKGVRKFRVVPVEETIDGIQAGTESYFTADDLPVLEKILETTRTRLGEPYKFDNAL